MSTPSNLYAEKVFSEHPIALWALDDKVDYVSLISEQQRSLSTWTITNGTNSVVTNVTDEPFISSVINQVTGNPVDSTNQVVECIGPDIFNFTTINQDLETFSLGAYVYSLTPYVTGFDIGYEYYDSTTGTNIQKLKHYETSISEKWIFISETFVSPKDNTTMRPVLKFYYIDGANDSTQYKFLVNGITIGQWSEEFNTFSLGVTPTNLPSNINLPQLKGIEAKAYGLQDNSGYYITDESSLCAKNSGVPMVYGASNTTTIFPNDLGAPGIIIPGNGFLNESGKFNDYTFETWLKVEGDSLQTRKIFGPIASTDGIYVDGPFLTLKIGKSYDSFCVGEWSKPMLIQIRYTKQYASLVLNGEQVIYIPLDINSISFPDQLVDNKSNDWLAFYAYDDLSPIEIDCVGIYSYIVPNIVAKKRFVYGQGVQIPENINSAYSGSSVFIDYPFANYSNNYSYPDLAKWSQANIDNLKVENNSLSLPDYDLPTFVSTNKTTSNLCLDNNSVQTSSNLFISLKPTVSWASTESYLFFDKIPNINSSLACVYGVFQYNNYTLTPQTLIRIEDSSSQNYLSLDLIGDVVFYKLKYGNQITTIYESDSIILGDKFSTGLNLNNFSKYFGGNVSSLLENRSGLRVYVGGNKQLQNTFSGNIYSINFLTDKNFSLVSDLFDDSGVPLEYENVFNQYYQTIDYDGGSPATSFWDDLIGEDGSDEAGLPTTVDRLSSHSPSYRFKPSKKFNIYKLDVDLNGTWEDNIPLTYFAKYELDELGNKKYSLNFLQFNLDYPRPKNYEEAITYSIWNYGELKQKYASPTQRDYSSLDNQLYTGYANYSDLASNVSKVFNFDTSRSLVKSYISFQYTASGANTPANVFKYKVKPQANGIINPGSYIVDKKINSSGQIVLINDSIMNTKYEIVNNTIIYPPSGIDFQDLSIVIHIEYDVESAISKPLFIKSLQLCSQSFSSGINEIGTRFGNSIYPYKKSGIYYDYKTQNPFSIYKGSSPYLYLTDTSGIQVRGTIDPQINRGVAVPINNKMSANYKVMAMQLAVKYTDPVFPFSPTSIFEIESKNGTIKFFIVADSPNGKRGKIYAINASTGKLEDGIVFYLNGNLVSDPVINTYEWAFIGIAFSNILNFNSYVGAFRINGPLLINLISHYKSTNLQEVQNVISRPWFKVKYSGNLTLDWDFWDVAYKWQGVLVLSSTSYYGVKPSDIYKAYAGTNKIIVDDYSLSDQLPKILNFKDYEYNIYKDIQWQSYVQNPV
jgi:hypothetical protein